jgi:hypothetical protein
MTALCAKIRAFDKTEQAIMGKLFVRFSDLLTQSERERLAELNKKGIPQHIRDEVNNTADEYWRNFKLASFVAATICLDESFERQEEVTALLEANQKKSRRKKLYLGLLGIAFWCGALYGIIRLVIWLAGLMF